MKRRLCFYSSNQELILIIMLFSLVILSFILTPVLCLAETITPLMQARLTIERIDSDAEKIAREKSAVASEIRNLRMFAKGAEAWFGRLNKINAKIRDAQKSKGEYTTFNTSQVDAQLQQLKNERSQLLNLNGGVTIQGQNYTSMDRLKYDYANINKQETELQKKHKVYRDALEIQDQKRNAASSQLEEHEKHDLSWNKTQIKILEDDIMNLKAVVNDKELWCMTGLIGYPVTRQQAMYLIKQDYLKEINTAPPKKYNVKELSNRILNQLEKSNQIKKTMRETAIPEKLQKIEALNRKIKEEESRSTDISGCWIIYLSDHDHPQVNITKTWDGYSAYITKVGVMDHLGIGHRLFVVHSVNKTVFEGLEYGTRPDGSDTTLKLRLILNKQGNTMDYRSDDILTMSRCN